MKRRTSLQIPSLPRTWFALLACCAAGCLGQAVPAAAHEVDQYTLPHDKEFVDLGSYWNRLLYDAVRGAVDETNFKIRQARKLPLEPARDALLSHYQSHDTLAWTVRRRLPSALWAIEGLELQLRWQNMVDAPAGKTFGYYAPVTNNVYSHAPDLPDPRQLSRMSLMRCSLIKVHGNYIGTDKIGHFIAMGFVGFNTYRAQINAGVGPEKALHQTIVMADVGPFGESGILGMLPTGIYSNADMAANYLGMKYYQNLMEPVTLRGRTVPPMVTVEDDLLVLNPQVRPDGPYFGQFISPHLDEVLNPSLYEWSMRDGVRREVRARSQDILDLYAGDDPGKRNPAYFEKLAKACSTYYGEAYGHSGHSENLISVANTCFDAQPNKSVGTVAASPPQKPPAVAYARHRRSQESDEGSNVWVSSGRVTRSNRPTAEAASHRFAEYEEVEPAAPTQAEARNWDGNCARATHYSSGRQPTQAR